MWHSDLHANNMFVNPEKPTEAIIDWQSVHLSPFFLQAKHPALIEFNGQIPEGFGRVELPENFADLSADEQKERRCSGPRSHYTNSTKSNCANKQGHLLRVAIPRDSGLQNYCFGWLAFQRWRTDCQWNAYGRRERVAGYRRTEPRWPPLCALPACLLSAEEDSSQ